jgi:hypothetical protein
MDDERVSGSGSPADNRSPASGGARRGLFDGFEAYRTPSAEDYAHALTADLVVPDANVLLNLYRYNPQTRDVLLTVLSRIGDRLWVPHQVVLEFWRNREAVLRDPRSTVATTNELTDIRDRALQVFRSWANRVSLATERSKELQDAVSSGFDVVIQGVGELGDERIDEYARDTNADPVLRGLEPTLNGRVGHPLDETEHGKAVSEGKRRAEQRQPPGYKDAGKAGDGVSGDYLVWYQILQEARRRRCDVLFVTGDVKEDWWRREQGQTRGPRPELVHEMQEFAGVRLFMLRPEGLLTHARAALRVAVEDDAVQDVERVDRFLSTDEKLPGGGWTSESIDALLLRLEREAPVQADVIRAAAERDGFISREDVYGIGEYGPERSLRGFTRPVNRIAQDLRDRGRVPQEACDVLVTEYDPNAPFGWAIGFRVPDDLLPLILTAQDAAESKDVAGE